MRRKATVTASITPPASPSPELPDRDAQCRIQVRFEGHEPLYYRASMAVAQQFARSAASAGAHVNIDDDAPTEGLRPLPCEKLWAT